MRKEQESCRRIGVEVGGNNEMYKTGRCSMFGNDELFLLVECTVERRTSRS